MAKFVLGALVTRISGSIGGTTFRKVGSLNVISNKSFGSSYSKLLSNAGLIATRVYTQSWFQLSDTDRGYWTAFAAATSVPDGFGGSKFLTGRQMFIKCSTVNARCTPSPISLPDLRAYTDAFTLADAWFSVSGAEGYVGVSGFTDYMYSLVSAEAIKSPAQAVVFNRRFSMVMAYGNIDTTIETSPLVIRAVPNLTVGQWVRVFVTPINISGFMGVPTYIDFQIEA